MRGRRRLTVAVVVVLLAAAATAAWAYWTVEATSGSAGAAAATSVNQGSTPTAVANIDHSITVSWSATTLANGDPVDGYLVTRYDATSPFAAQTTLADCNGVVDALTCTETAVPPGSWQYTITAVKGDNWMGPESEKSGIVTSAAVLTLDQTIYGLSDFGGGASDATVTGSLTGFEANEGISYRLDASTSLTGTPPSANGSGNASVSVTLPRPADGSHTIYALGDASSEASAAILVDTTAPDVSASLSPAANDAGWNNSTPVAVTLTADDGLDSSGVDEVKYTTDGSDPTTSGTAQLYSDPFDVTSDTTVKFFATDLAGNASVVGTQEVQIDTIAPTNDLSLDPMSGNALLDGSTLWYRGVAAGSFTLANALTDSGGSGPASTGYAALSGTSTGWSFTSSSATSGPPYVSNEFSWDAGTASSPSEAATGYDVADNFTTTNLTFANDSTGPSGGSVDATGLVGTGSRYSNSTTLSIALAKGTDEGVGVATSGAELLRASAPLLSSDGQADGTCGVYSGYAPLLTDPTSPYADNAAGGISPGNCYRYEYLVSDKLGNQTAYTSGDVKIETAPPASLTPSLTLSSATGNTYVNGTTVYTNPQAGKSGSFVASATASDATSGMLKVNFPGLTGFTSGGGDDLSSPFQTTYSWSGAGASASGAQTVTATDNATLTATSAFTVTPDTTNPTISASAKNADNSTYTADTWTNQTVTVHYTCSDGGSGIATCPADQTFSTDGVTASSSGTATDNVGNQAGASFGPIKVDKTNPSISASATKADTTAYTASTWTNQTVTVHYTCSDGGSGIASCPADQVFSTDGVTSSTSGTATDNASNQANASFGPIKIDKTKPTTTLTTSPASPDGTNSWFKQSSVSFTLLGSDGASGVANSFYTIDGGSTQTYSSAVTISTQGDHTVTFWSTDNAGNVENTNSTHIKLDNIAPATTIATTPASANGSNGWFVSPNSSVSFSLSATDATSGAASRFYTIDGGATQTYSTAVTVNTNGDHTILYWSTDNAGNVESQNTFHIKIDTAAPSTTLTTSPASPDGSNSWFKQSSVSFTLATTDTTSGAASRFYTIDGGATQTYSGAVTINTQGDHTVTYWSTDSAGNVESANTTHIKIDNVASVSAIPTTTPASPNGSNSWFVSPNSSVSFTLTATDATSGVANRFYTLDGGATQTYSTAVVVTGNGDHTILYWSTDNAGNVESQNVFHIKIDTTPPTNVLLLNTQSTKTGPAGTTVPTSGLSGTTLFYDGGIAGSLKIRNALTDAHSGPASSAFAGTTSDNKWTALGNGTVSTPAGGPFDSGTFTWSSGATATFTETVTGADNAGNNNAGTALALTNDRTDPGNPTITFPAAAGDYTNASWDASSCASGTICGTASDAGSGIAKVQLSIKATSGANINKFWDPSTSGFTSSTEVLVLAAGTNSWSLSFPSSNFSDANYLVTAYTSDFANNFKSVTAAFDIDNVAPTPVITFPVNGSTHDAASWAAGANSKITGTASDSLSGVASDQVAIQRASGNYWNGTSFSSATPVYTTTAGTTSWNLAFAATNFPADSAYTVYARSTDAAGNVSASVTSTFNYDNTNPTVAMTFPAASGVYNAASWTAGCATAGICGTATDPTGAAYVSGLSAVTVSIKDVTAARWWNGTAFTTTSDTLLPATGTTSWSFAFAASNLVSGHTFQVHAHVTDNAGNTADLTPAAFTYDNTAPTVTPVAIQKSSGGTAGFVSQGGTYFVYANVTDTGGANISTVTANASSITTGATSTTLSTTGGPWTIGAQSYNYRSAQLTADNPKAEGAYSFSVTATDGAANQTSLSGSVTIDNTRPTSSITFPAVGGNYNTAGWSGSISGTASDASAGVASVAVTIQQVSSGNYWNGTGFTSSTPVSFTATGTTSWSLTFAAANFATDGTYVVTSTATDNAANVQTTSASNTFVVDKTIPTASITFPNGGNYTNATWSGALTGTAFDATSGVANVQVAVQQGSGNYWNPATSSFSSASAVFFAATGTTSWSVSFPASNFPADGSYTVSAKSTDVANNTSTTVTNTFKIDNVAPTSSITFPTNGGNYNTAGWTGSITGSGSDATSGVASVAVTIQQQGTGNYWNGSSFGSATPVSLAATGTTSWSLSFAAANFTTDGTYVVTSTATDSAGLVQTSAASNTFVVDKTNPTASLTFPANNGNYNTAGWSGSLTGTSADATAGVTNVQVAVQQGTGNYWNPATSSFSSAIAVFFNATGTTSWSATFPASNFTVDGSYTVYAKSTDAANNVSATVSNTFKVDKTNPTAAITFPASAGSYNTAGWTGSLTGSATDATSGLASVQVAVQQGSGNYWDPGTSSFSSSSQLFFTATGTTSWSYAFAASNFPADGSYTLYAKSTDVAGNTSAVASNTFKFDTSAPTSSITFPANSGNYNAAGWTGTISGPASDATSGIANVKLTIQQQSTGNYWSGSAFNSASPVLLTATGTTSWTFTFAAANFVTDGTYIVTSTATDSAGNVQTTSASNTFVVDKTVPTASITFPNGGNYTNATWSGTLTGSALDATSGVTSVEYAVQRGTGNYWNGTSFSSATQVFSPATGTNSWSAAFAASNFPADGSYTVYARSTDAAGNVSTIVSNTFKIDNVAPASSITFPANNANYTTSTWTGSITGSASDATSGVASVAVTIQQQGTGNYWNGSSFGSATPVSLAATGTTSWSLSFAAANFTTDGTYVVTSTATDNAGLVQTSAASNTFVVDKTNPAAAITFPVANGNYSTTGWTGTITGTASDATSGVTTVQYAVQLGTGNYWNGTTFGSATPFFINASGTTSWSASFAAANFTVDGSYTVYAKSTDAATNVSTTVSTTFKVDKTNPTVALTFPANSANYNAAGWTGSLTGTATDATSGVTAVQVSVQQGSGNYWDPGTSSFSSATALFFTATGTTSWSASFPLANFSADGSYTVSAKSTDAAGNTSSVSSNTFKIDTTAPAVAITAPTNNGDYNATGWGPFTGTASDATSGLSTVRLTIQQQSSGNYWNGSAFASASPVLLTPSGTTSWSLTFAATNFATDGTYVVNATATDNAGSSQSSSSTFVIDKTLPTATITFPAASGNYNAAGWTGSITGTASDATSSVTTVQYAVQQGTGNYWNGSSFSSASAVFFAATGTNSWSAAFAAANFPADGSYTVQAKSTDAANNTSTTVSNTLKIDNTNPTVALTFPANAATYDASSWNSGASSKITGTAADATAGVGSVTIAMQQGSGNYWDPGTSSFSSSLALFFNATGTTTWNAAFPASNFTTDSAYTVYAKSTDAAGNASATTSRTFNYDNTNPTVSITFPSASTSYNTAGWTGSITGTASDPSGGTFISGLANVKLSIRDVTAGKYWGGTSFNSTPEFFVTPTGTTSWSYALAASALTNAHTYEVHAQATDSAANVANATNASVVYDTVVPTTTITFPAAGTSYKNANWTGSVAGTAADTGGSGVAIAQIAVQQGSGNYWDPGTSSFSSASAVFFTATGTTSWTVSFPVANFPADGSYTVSAKSTDSAGNVSTTATSTFKIDNVAPTLSSVVAANGGANPGKVETSDTLTFTYSDATSGVDPSSISSGWNGSGSVTGVLLTFTNGGASNDTITVPGIGTVDLGGTGYLTSANSTKTGTLTMPATNQFVVTITQNPSNQGTGVPAATFTWSAAGGTAADFAGNAATGSVSTVSQRF
jgi:hypothetical protein